MGMQWIKDNVGKFNGDSDNITLGGASAGGVAAQLHMAHAESHHLFHNAIVISPAQSPLWSTDDAMELYGKITGTYFEEIAFI